MKRIKLTVAYDGTNYCGWQIQPNGITIQQVLEECLLSLFGEKIRISGASRTDTGVHALGNVAVFNTQSRMPAERISYALNTYLPPDIRILDSREVPEDFHPRFCKTYKTYEYRIWNHRFSNPCQRLYSLFYYRPLDEEKMRQAAEYLRGTHDFTSFCTAKPGVTNRTRTITDLDVARTGNLISFRIRGDGFLYNMVRIIAGTLIQAGIGEIEPEQMADILEGRDRALAGDTARPEGLTLMGIEYPEWDPDNSWLDETVFQPFFQKKTD